MTIDFLFYAQLTVFCLNIIVFIFLMNEHNFNFKTARIVLLIAISVGAVINFGRVTFFTVVMAFTPFLTLINIKQDGKLYRLFKRIGDSFGRHSQPVQKLQRDRKTIHH